MRRFLILIAMTAALEGQVRSILDDIARKGSVEGVLHRPPGGRAGLRVKDHPEVMLDIAVGTPSEEIFELPVTAKVAVVNGKPVVVGPELVLTSVAAFDRLKAKFSPETRNRLSEPFERLRTDASKDSGKMTVGGSVSELRELLYWTPLAALMRAPAPDTSLAGSARRSEQAIVEQYAATPPTQIAQRKALLQLYSEARKMGKALYGRNPEYYRPLGYGRVLSNSRGTLALVQAGEPICSGVLISDDLVLTARHCVADRFVQNLSVWFNYELDLSSHELNREEFPIAGPIVAQGTALANGSVLDFALLRVGAAPDGSKPGDRYPNQCMSLAPAQRDAGLYVIGHPKGEHRMVHDDGWVYFPFRVNAHEHTELEMNVALEVANSPDRDERVQEFERSYVPRNDPVLGPVWENYSLRWDGQPTIGAKVDTFHGNSGGPVYDRGMHRMIGMLRDGEPDVEQPWTAGWVRHEAILPLESILAQIDAQMPGWEEREKVCVYRSPGSLVTPALNDYCSRKCN